MWCVLRYNSSGVRESVRVFVPRVSSGVSDWCSGVQSSGLSHYDKRGVLLESLCDSHRNILFSLDKCDNEVD